MEALLGLLYPQERSCLSCRSSLPEENSTWNRNGPSGDWPVSLPREPVAGWASEIPLCPRCQADLIPIEPPYCLLCGRHIEEPGRCPECIRGSAFVLSRSYGKYEGVLRDMLHRFKFSREEKLLPILGSCLCQGWNLHMAHFSTDWLVPVPAHPKRIKERGYNQAERLALHLSSYSNIPLLPALQRQIHLKGQATRNRQERLKALQGTYVCDPAFLDAVSGSSVLLVDDIYTTGATAEACARALMEAGAEQVYVITVAR
ncbi:ComF family protein [Effusibacillus lacus]|nr:ComF family protein [Effusibacillus lacus]